MFSQVLAAPSLAAPLAGASTQGAGLLEQAATYSFRDSWRIRGTLEHVAEAFSDTASLSTWWPTIREVRVLSPGTGSGLGRLFQARIRGYLPYELRLQFAVTEAAFPTGFAVELTGDFHGTGRARLRQLGEDVEIQFALQIRIERPLLRWLSLLFRPLMAAQHDWTMAMGAASLNRALHSRLAA